MGINNTLTMRFRYEEKEYTFLEGLRSLIIRNVAYKKALKSSIKVSTSWLFILCLFLSVTGFLLLVSFAIVTSNIFGVIFGITFGVIITVLLVNLLSEFKQRKLLDSTPVSEQSLTCQMLNKEIEDFDFAFTSFVRTYIQERFNMDVDSDGAKALINAVIISYHRSKYSLNSLVSGQHDVLYPKMSGSPKLSFTTDAGKVSCYFAPTEWVDVRCVHRGDMSVKFNLVETSGVTLPTWKGQEPLILTLDKKENK